MIAALMSLPCWRALVAVLLFASVAAGQGLDELQKKLADSDEHARRAAVEGLSRQNGVAALELVLKSLRDPSAMVADEAQLALGNVDEEAEFELLFSKDALFSKDDLVRMRCAEAIGRVDAKLASARLEKSLSDKHPGVRRAMVYSIECLARRLAIVESPALLLRKELIGLVNRDSSGGVRAAAVMALAALPPGLSNAELATFAVDKSYEVRSAALLAAAELEPKARSEFARQGLKDAHSSVRLQAVAALSKAANRDAALQLADGLESEKSARVAWSMVAGLRRMSGLKAGRDARYWQQWARALPLDWKPTGADNKPVDSEGKTATLVGLPILSERVTFLVDLSGSMWEEVDGKTRKQGAGRELEIALQGLAPATEFNLIPFTLTPIPWQDQLQSATAKNVSAALAFFGKRMDRGKGNFWDALQLALVDPNVDTVVMLGDGAPTGGIRWNVELMRKLFEEQNRFRLVELDAVLVDCSKGMARTWTSWCESTGGRTRETDLR